METTVAARRASICEAYHTHDRPSSPRMNLRTAWRVAPRLDRAAGTPRHHYFDTVKISLDGTACTAYCYLDDVKINSMSNLFVRWS
jgi:hypothetical protein